MNIAIILAAGSGTRMGNASVPKQFLMIYNKPIVVHTIEQFEMHFDIDEIVVVTKKDYIDEIKVWIRQFDLSKVHHVVEGGDTRQASVYNGLLAIAPFAKDDDIVLIHDSARPLVNGRIISDNIEGALRYGAVDTVIPSADTIIHSQDGEKIDDVPLRKELFLGQTPQSFRYEKIIKAHQEAIKNHIENASDDAQLIRKNQGEVYLVNGDRLNFKITTFDDLMMLKALLKIGKTEVQ